MSYTQHTQPGDAVCLRAVASCSRNSSISEFCFWTLAVSCLGWRNGRAKAIFKHIQEGNLVSLSRRTGEFQNNCKMKAKMSGSLDSCDLWSKWIASSCINISWAFDGDIVYIHTYYIYILYHICITIKQYAISDYIISYHIVSYSIISYVMRSVYIRLLYYILLSFTVYHIILVSDYILSDCIIYMYVVYYIYILYIVLECGSPPKSHRLVVVKSQKGRPSLPNDKTWPALIHSNCPFWGLANPMSHHNFWW